MKDQHRNGLFLVAALVLSSGTGRAQSGNSAVAQALFDQARQLLADGHAAEACPKLEESQRLEPRSGTLINLASCYEQTGRLASAWSKYIEAGTAAKASGNPDREVVAREHAAALAPRLSKLTIMVAPALKSVAGLEITRDGVEVRDPEWGLALPSDPGDHEITAKAPGRAPFQTKISVTGEGQSVTASVPELAALAGAAVDPGDERLFTPPPPKTGLGTSRSVALVAGGIGVLGVGLGTVFGLASKSKHDQAENYCNGAACRDPRGVTAGSAAQSDGNISTVMMIVGGVGLAAGVTLWLTAPKTHSGAPSAQVGLGLGALQVKAAF
jgi:hypothetical protein